jgi:hypothetical protein
MPTPSPIVANIARAIRRHLQAHPHAMDTERGIGEWWVRSVGPRHSDDDVRDAIEHLVASGELLPIALPDGQVAYALGPGPRSPGSA